MLTEPQSLIPASSHYTFNITHCSSNTVETGSVSLQVVNDPLSRKIWNKCCVSNTLYLCASVFDF